jgi:hypothetical protein
VIEHSFQQLHCFHFFSSYDILKLVLTYFFQVCIISSSSSSHNLKSIMFIVGFFVLCAPYLFSSVRVRHFFLGNVQYCTSFSYFVSCFIHNTSAIVLPDLCFTIPSTVLCISVPTQHADETQGKLGSLFQMPKVFPTTYSNLQNVKHLCLQFGDSVNTDRVIFYVNYC